MLVDRGREAGISVTTSLPRPARTHRVPTRLGGLHVRETGAGPTALLWHGAFVDGTSWNRIVPALAMRRRLLIVDGPGHGHSDTLARRSSIDECVGVATELLDGLGVDTAVDWVGNAWGGHVGIELAAAHPGRVRSLVAIASPTEPPDEALRRRLGMLVPLIRLIGATGAVHRAILEAQLTSASRSDRVVRALVDDALARASPASLSRALASFVVDRDDSTPRLPAIGAPALFVASDDLGEWSPADAAAAADLARHAESVVVSGARTLVPLERPEILAEHILRLWSTTRP